MSSISLCTASHSTVSRCAVVGLRHWSTELEFSALMDSHTVGMGSTMGRGSASTVGRPPCSCINAQRPNTLVNPGFSVYINHPDMCPTASYISSAPSSFRVLNRAAPMSALGSASTRVFFALPSFASANRRPAARMNRNGIVE